MQPNRFLVTQDSADPARPECAGRTHRRSQARLRSSTIRAQVHRVHLLILLDVASAACLCLPWTFEVELALKSRTFKILCSTMHQLVHVHQLHLAHIRYVLIGFCRFPALACATLTPTSVLSLLANSTKEVGTSSCGVSGVAPSTVVFFPRTGSYWTRPSDPFNLHGIADQLSTVSCLLQESSASARCYLSFFLSFFFFSSTDYSLFFLASAPYLATRASFSPLVVLIFFFLSLHNTNSLHL